MYIYVYIYICDSVVQKPSFYADLLASEHFALNGFSWPFVTCLFFPGFTDRAKVTWVFAATCTLGGE